MPPRDFERSFNIRPIETILMGNDKDAERVRGLDLIDHATVGVQYVRDVLTCIFFFTCSEYSKPTQTQVLTTSTRSIISPIRHFSFSRERTYLQESWIKRASSLLRLWDSRSDPWLKPFRVTWVIVYLEPFALWSHLLLLLLPQHQQFQLRNPRILSCRIWNHFTISYPNAKACFSPRVRVVILFFINNTHSTTTQATHLETMRSRLDFNDDRKYCRIYPQMHLQHFTFFVRLPNPLSSWKECWRGSKNINRMMRNFYTSCTDESYNVPRIRSCHVLYLSLCVCTSRQELSLQACRCVTASQSSRKSDHAQGT